MFTLFALNYTIPQNYYNANDFKIKTVYSSIDFDKDYIDDYSDFVLGAREDIKNNPTYISKYYDNAYPPDNEGVCTDTIWRAFKHAGYSLKDMIDLDIQNNLSDYKEITTPDPNIDFRRVKNLSVFFKKYAESLTTNPDDFVSWQPGDIVIFGNDKHIGIISDKRNKLGIPYVIHNNGHGTKEEDYLTKSRITGHYRFDASKIEKTLLIEWKN
jgi:uncharacterized protein YijF (DUF1287 family)